MEAGENYTTFGDILNLRDYDKVTERKVSFIQSRNTSREQKNSIWQYYTIYTLLSATKYASRATTVNGSSMLMCVQ